jgi:tRNA-Thr(GGU) m(6)t(6)A37 methyltransferase TsaA
MIELEPIGLVRTQHRDAADVPLQTYRSPNVRGRVILASSYREGLQGLEGFDYVHLIVLLDRARSPQLTVEPLLVPGSGMRVGVFATRHPARPNRLGLSLVRLKQMTEDGFEFSGVDLLDETPLLDIKPYEPRIDSPWTRPVRSGWYAQTGATHT